MTEYERIVDRERRIMRRVKIGFWLAAALLVACDVVAYLWR